MKLNHSVTNREAKGEQIGWLGGVTVRTKEAKLVFDPVPGSLMENDAHVFISHAHADHTFGFSSGAAKYSTIETKKIFEDIRKKTVRNFKEVKLRHRVKVGDAAVSALNAGHILGSIQFKVELPQKTILYTGDINCVDTLTTFPADEIRCDLLVIEATYGNPFYVFPHRDRTYAKIVEWATQQAREGRVPTFHVYAAGKAQEIVRLFNVYTKLNVVTHPLIARVNQTYSNEGIRLQYTSASDDEAAKILEGGACVCVTTPSTQSFSVERSVRAVATGWAVRMPLECLSAFPLSSHADFKQLTQFVKATRAKTVYTFTGYTNMFASYLQRKLGVDARPIPAFVQRRLFEF